MKFITKREMLDMVGVSYQTIWRKMQDGAFPLPVDVAGRRLWVEDEVRAWQDALLQDRVKYPAKPQLKMDAELGGMTGDEPK